jgi:hypothetical protein
MDTLLRIAGALRESAAFTDEEELDEANVIHAVCLCSRRLLLHDMTLFLTRCFVGD